MLKLDDFLAALSSLGLFNILESFFLGEGSLKELLVSRLLCLALDGSEFSLGSVVVNELEVPLSVENELLSLGFFIGLDFPGPLVLEHLLLSGFLFSVDVFCLRNGVLLPREDVEGFLDLLFLELSLVLLSLHLFLVVEHPELSINLLLDDGLLHLLFFVHELLFSLELSSCDHEGGLLFSQIVGLHFEFPFESVLHEILFLLFSLGLEGIESLGHFSSDLFGGLESSHKFLFVHFIFGSQQCSESALADLEVRGLPFFHVCNSVPDNILGNNCICFNFPCSFKIQILISSYSILEDGFFCLQFSSCCDMSITFEFL